MKLLYLTNIPAPYRIKRFNDMNEVFLEKGVELEVMFMSKTEPDRDWDVNLNEAKFKYKIWPGFHPQIGYVFAHFNPTLLIRLLKRNYDAIIIGGISAPTLILAPFFIGKKAFKILSNETNLLGVTKKGRFMRHLKGWLMSRADGYQVTGELQKDYIKYFSPSAKSKPFIVLPNLINGAKFYQISSRSKDNKNVIIRKFNIQSSGNLICIIPARLVDIKYPEAFLKAIKAIKGVHFLLVGSGPMENKIKAATNGLSVTMIPFQQESDIIELYGISDLFCLPSITDASPLSTIEAICCSLPILISDRVGNKLDVLCEGKNGYSFDPFLSKSVIDAFGKFTSQSDDQRNAMGISSRQIYLEKFENRKCLLDYTDVLINTVNRNSYGK